MTQGEDEMDKDIKFISKKGTTLKLMMNGYSVTLNFLPLNNDKLIEQVKAMLTSSLADAARNNKSASS